MQTIFSLRAGSLLGAKVWRVGSLWLREEKQFPMCGNAVGTELRWDCYLGKCEELYADYI